MISNERPSAQLYFDKEKMGNKQEKETKMSILKLIVNGEQIFFLFGF